jgi:hypothetical protein
MAGKLLESGDPITVRSLSFLYMVRLDDCMQWEGWKVIWLYVNGAAAIAFLMQQWTLRPALSAWILFLDG